jgi:fermentation-respiration switch protein FrsA (DUF1100 family)
MEERITYYSDGLKMSGILRLPADYTERGRLPAVIVCPGFMSTAESLPRGFAEELCTGGCIALTLDYRGFGQSEGPRGRVIPMEEVVDISNAISYLQSRPEVNPDQIGLLGISLGGGNSIYVATQDRRAKCVVSMVAMSNAERRMRRFRTDAEWEAFLKRLQQDRIHRVLTGKSEEVDPYAEIIIIQHDPYRGALHQESKTTLETADAYLHFKPEDVVDKVSPTPILFIQAGKDELIPGDASIMHAKAKDPKKLVTLPDVTHFDFYGNALKEAMEPVVEWFQQHLR